MHELGIARNIVAIVSEAARGRRVTRVTLEVGRLSGVMGEAIAFCFEAIVPGTALEGARLDIEDIEARARCEACGSEIVAPTLLGPCACGSRRLVWLAGEELKVKSMELSEAA